MPGYCFFTGLVMPSDTLAITLRTPSDNGHEFLHPDASSTSRPLATLYSRTDFDIGGNHLTAGLYKLFPQKSEKGWVLNIARQSGEWNDPVTDSQFIWHAGMNSIDDHSPDHIRTIGQIMQMWSWPRTASCRGFASGVAVREIEFAVDETDVSFCVALKQAPPAAREEVSASR